MGFAQLLFHLGNFILPALGMALLMPLAGRWVMGSAAMAWHRRALWHALLGTAVLVLGLLWQGQDGAMATYLALVLGAASLEWGLHRPWRRG